MTRGRAWPVVLGSFWFSLEAAAVDCPGDCGADGRVTVDEILQVTASALGDSVRPACASSDGDGDGTVTVADILLAVQAALEGCGAEPTGLADLAITQARGWGQAPSCAEDEQNPSFDLCIRNHGAAAAAAFVVGFESNWPGASRFPVWEIPGLSAGAEICMSVPLFTSVQVVADLDDAVREVSEENNQRAVFLPTLTRGPGCTPTPTPTGRAGCCEFIDGCDGDTDRRDCFSRGGTGFEDPVRCEADTGACDSPSAATPQPTATPARPAPDLVPVSVRPALPPVAGHRCPGPDCLLACVRNAGTAASPSFELSIGSYWRRRIDGLAPLHHACVLAARPEGGTGELVADSVGEVGESDEGNNRLSFTLVTEPPNR